MLAAQQPPLEILEVDMAKKKSWREKLSDSKELPKVVTITEKMSKRWGTGTVVVPAPIEVDEIMKKVPKGRFVTITRLWPFLSNVGSF